MIKKTAIALLSTTLVFGGTSLSLLANSLPVMVSQRQDDWEGVLRMARLVNSDRETTALVLQLDIDDKPQTTYANVVYQVFGRINGRWTELYTNTGARLIAGAPGGATLATEVIDMDELYDDLDDTVNLSNLELKAIAQIRYDVRGRRDQRVTWEVVDSYSTIAQTTSSQRIVVNQPQSTTTAGRTVIETETREQRVVATQRPLGEPNNQLNPHRGHFSLAIRQSQVTIPEVIARVSLKYKREDSFLRERLVGDFRYRMNQRAQFIRGVNPGDRVVVRLFDPQGYFLGYSEFELLEDNAAVNLVLSDDVTDGVVRTVYGIDGDRNGAIDQGVQVYDYFTRVTNISSTTYQNANVIFYDDTSNIDTRFFNIAGLPSPRRNCVYPLSFQNGSFAIARRTLRAFSSGLAPALVAEPGEVVQITTVSSTTISSYEVSNLILDYREVGYTEGVITRTCDLGCVGDIDDDDDWDDDDDDDDDDWDDDDDDWDDDDDDNGRYRRNCNQGIGNGPEGCDPGRSRPRGGSNDEGGRTPGNRPR